MAENTTQWNVIVIGGGPAGMIAAGRAAERGRSVLLLEKNSSLGRKLLMTGGGRCNLTNCKSPLRAFLSAYQGASDFLYSPFSQFNSKDTIHFFEILGVTTKEENEGRIFPTTDKAESIKDALERYMHSGNVQIKTNVEIKTIERNSKQNIFEITPRVGKTYTAQSCVIATGGTSYPDTGSTGDGFVWLKTFGHTIKKSAPALVPIVLKDAWVGTLAGLSLENIKLTAILDGERMRSEKGKMLFTHTGISGPAALHLSKTIGELLSLGDPIIELDLFPTRDAGVLRRMLQEILITESNKKIKNVLSAMIPNALVAPVLRLAEIGENTFNHSVHHDERVRLSLLLKAIPFHCKALLGPDKAIVSSGGVTLEEIETKTMQSKIIPNLFLVGDILDVDRPSGGYSLQLCWTTGYVAGSHC